MVEGLLHRSARVALRGAGWLSEGVRIGLEEGFDSAASLEHGYRNVPSGRLGIGRVLDRVYLDQRGWHALRHRGEQLQQMIAERIRVAAQERPADRVTLVDLGAGRARHTLQGVVDSGVSDRVDVWLIDQDASSLEHARTSAAALGVGDGHFIEGDVFREDLLQSLPDRCDIVVASGLYEWFDDRKVAKSLTKLSAKIPPGGAVVYTGHPWHPNARWMDHVLPSRRGGTCRMTRRSQESLDRLLHGAGYHKSDTREDPWGIFTVSLAIRSA